MKLSVSVLMLLTLGAVGEVVENFTKVVDCGKFFLNGEPPEFKIGTQIGTASQGRYVPICQRYKNKYHYATLYDTAEKIPVYSAYRYERTPDCTGKRPVLTWMIEPQLENNNNGGEMILQKQMKINRQAYNSEYEDSRYDKGHLFPFCHTNSDEAAESTFTLTNAAPQRCDFNKMWYSKVEYRVRKNLTDCLNASKRAYVVTGVVPSKEKQTLKKGSTVNVPSHFWTAYCCCDNNSKCKFGAYIMHKEADEPTNYEDEELIDFHKDLDELYKPMTMKVFNEKYITGEKRRRIQ
ncbi:endonuclease domain-containing 1 protein-like [Colossoma macropomum]|uniref:endonuclease domain-containing 1 protein-like n=1 Tax=Colossoma macropomum TaxID=42526 RepID=UPI0018641319|nr:endonuclease domain-containing 1 protein-like [Colossoma macropomum]